MEKHSKECEIKQLRQKVREHEERIEKLSEYKNKMKKEFSEGNNNPQKENRYRSTMKEHDETIKNLK